MEFIGRKEQMDQLMSLWRKGTSSLVTCQGRRRIGKSRLIDEFAERSGCRYLKLSGLAPRKKMTDKDQLGYFCKVLSERTGVPGLSAENWIEAFGHLGRVVSENGGHRMVVLLDEISWMGAYNMDFPGYLKDAWDDNLKKNQNLVLVLCGSVSSWIQHNILDSTGFVGRISLELLITELPACDCVKFWRQMSGSVSSREVFDMLSVTGGVPRYLEEIDPALTTDENIRRLAFTRSGTLFKDFTRIFNDVFGKKSKVKQDMLKSLAYGSKSLSEISASMGRSRSGHFTDALEELELAGFIERDHGINPETGEPSKIDLYRIRDNYTRFYLRFIAPYASMVKSGAFRFASLDSMPGWDGVLGLQFENLVLGNVQALIAALGLDRSLVLSAAPYRKSGSRKQNGVASMRGCQIDILIQQRQTMYVVEVKRREFINASIVEEVKEKISRLPNPRGLSIRPVLVYDGRLSPSVNEDGYFAATFAASELLLH